MKKIIATIIVFLLTLGSFSAIATDYEKQNGIEIQTENESIYFSSLTVEKADGEYIELQIKELSNYLMKSGKPILPKLVKVIELPFKATNIKVNVELGEITEQKITKEIKPCPRMLPLVSTSKELSINQIKDESIYQSRQPYPKEPFEYRVYSGLNDKNVIKKQVVLDIYPVSYNPSESTIETAKTCDIEITYEMSEEHFFSKNSDTKYDLVIITPKKFEKHLQKLVEHKNNTGTITTMKTTEEIYEEYTDKKIRDEPEKIKYFIKDALDNWNITYVLLVGGLKHQIHASPRDGPSKGVSGWYLPVRYTSLYDKPKYPLESTGLHDPGVISDLYYADIYDGESKFSSWDPNEDDIFAAWGHPDYPKVKNDTGIDMVPDVYVGRLPCRNIREVKTVVDKIITYESTQKDDWFNEVTVISGDGFLDQEDLNFKWDTTGLENGNYTIYAQSFNDEEAGPKDTIHIKIDRKKETDINFNHDDHLNPALEEGYPAPPIAEIVTISPGDTLGFRDVTYSPEEGEAYCNNFNPWANISYVDGVLTIRGKSYDPSPYGNVTDIHVWIKDSKNGETVFSEWRNDTEMYYEGEWVTGEKSLLGRGGALYYMDGFEKNIVWTSNGKLTCQDDVIKELNKGSGFVFMSGHGSPNVWADHYPGVPGNRGPASVTGLQVTTLSIFPPFIRSPAFPIDTLSNKEKLPVTVIGGCHNSQFNVSMLLGLYEGLPYIFNRIPILKNIEFPKKYMWCHGQAVPECFSWRLVRTPNGGAIATIGNTGLGYGMPGKFLTTGGGDGWISIEFFRQYGEHDHTILGQAHSQSITSYIQNFDMTDLESGHPKTVQQWALIGDPSLKIGGSK